MPGLPIIFFILAVVAVATAIGTILNRNTVYAAMLLVLNFATIAMLYLILGAPFIALSQITVYAGSIMVLFLFVIMLLGVERLKAGSIVRGQSFAIVVALVLVGTFGYYIFSHLGVLTGTGDLPANYGAPEAIGELLFTRFTLPFEITAVILLSAVVGAIILAKPDKPSSGQAARSAKVNIPAPVGAPSADEDRLPAAVQEEAAPAEAGPSEPAPSGAVVK
jgi:NADH-quinone oxidoreductase subunit J